MLKEMQRLCIVQQPDAEPNHSDSGGITMAKTRYITCDSCELLSINGLPCHEHGCPNTNATWDTEQGEWVRTRTCFECGCECPEGSECCAEEEL